MNANVNALITWANQDVNKYLISSFCIVCGFD